MTMFEMAIFDLDGVIVDTAKYHYLAWHRLGKELGFNFTKEDNERLKGVSRMRSLDILLEVGGIEKTAEEKEALAAKKNQWYVDYIMEMDESEILPGVLSFINELHQAKIRTALGSASKNARTILERVGLTNHFDVIVDGNLVSKAKPDPEVFLLAAQKLQIPPDKCIVFEDAQAGIEAGNKAGMLTIGIGDPQLLKDANLVFSGFEELTLLHLIMCLA